MTIEELDDTLRRLNLDISTEEGMRIRNMILARHGRDILESKRLRCSHCWLKDGGSSQECPPSCIMRGISEDDPAKASLEYLSRPNDVVLLPFVCIYVIPTYEEISGDRGVMDKIANDFRSMMAKRRLRGSGTMKRKCEYYPS